MSAPRARASSRVARRRAALGAALLAACTACGGEPPFATTPLEVDVPWNLGAEVVSPSRNPLTVEGVALGRSLFVDERLSGSGRHSCASCHRPDLAFTDGRPQSLGESGVPTLRHAPSLLNVAFVPSLFWDGGSHDLESQAFAPFENSRELGISNDALLAALEDDDALREGFERAFSEGLTLANVGRALAQYERTLVQASSRYDRLVRGELGVSLTELELRGLTRFETWCQGCHAVPFFSDFAFHNNGLDDAFSEADERVAWGRARITHRTEDVGCFKTPSLRNVARTAPYMHDGRFATLRDAVLHYRDGVKASPTLDERIPTDGLPLELADVDALVAFLGTLTDEE